MDSEADADTRYIYIADLSDYETAPKIPIFIVRKLVCMSRGMDDESYVRRTERNESPVVLTRSAEEGRSDGHV